MAANPSIANLSLNPHTEQTVSASGKAKLESRGLLGLPCPRCRAYSDSDLPACPICATPKTVELRPEIGESDAAEIIYQAVWADPTGNTYRNAARALLSALRRRGER